MIFYWAFFIIPKSFVLRALLRSFSSFAGTITNKLKIAVAIIAPATDKIVLGNSLVHTIANSS